MSGVRGRRAPKPIPAPEPMVPVDGSDPDAGRDLHRITEDQLLELSAREGYATVLEHASGNGFVVQLIENPAIKGPRRYATRTRGGFGGQAWRLRGNGTMGGIWLTRASACTQWLNQSLPDNGEWYAVMAA